MDYILISVLYEQINQGNKADGDWKTQAYQAVAQELNSKMGMDLNWDQVRSRVRLWKKHHATVAEIRQKTKFYWDESRCQFVNGKEDVTDWIEYCEASPGTPGLKKKAEAMENTSNQEMASKESKDSQKKWYCSLCVVSTTSEGALNHHFQGKKHKAKEANLRANETSSMSINGYSAESSQLPDKEKSTGPNKWRCSLCQVSVSSEMHLRAHLQGRKHKAKEAKLGLEQNVSNMDCSSIEKSQENVQADDGEDVKTEASKKWYCPLCQVSALSEKNLNDHFQGKKHKAKSAEKVLELAELTKDKSAGNDVGTDFAATKPGKCEEKQEATCNAAMEKIELERKSSSSLEETSDTKEVEFEQITGNELETDTEKSGDSDQVNKDEMCDNLKYWHCQMCNESTCNEAAMAAHRKGNKHKTLLHKNGGGVIIVARVPKEAVV